MTQAYLIALGSNIHVTGLGGPRVVIEAALEALAARGIVVIGISPIIRSDPLGPSQRRYANACGLVETALAPPDLLTELQRLETAFGRGRSQRRGSRWRSRVLDLDIVLWSGGIWTDSALHIPHPDFRNRSFVLGPATAIVPDWKDPITGFSIAHLNARNRKGA